jgi:molybdate transport system substrate-binding protein
MRLAVLALALLSFAPPPPAALTVFAASDLGPPFRQVVPQFESMNGVKVTLVLGSTGMLAQQIRNGAPADVFFAANESFITDLAAESLTLPQTHTIYARGRIAIVTLKAGGVRANDLKALATLPVKRIAIANPQHAPYGLAAKQALEAAGLWASLEPKLVFGENVQQAVQFVRSGSAEVGIVARSVADTPDLNWTVVDERLHAPLNQAAAVIAGAKQAAAAMTFIQFVSGERGRAVMKQFGFEK